MGVGCSWLARTTLIRVNSTASCAISSNSYGGKIVDEVYVPMVVSAQRLREILVRAKELAPDVVFSTIVGCSAICFIGFYREAGLDPASMPIASLTMAEARCKLSAAAPCEVDIMAAMYFGSLRGSSNCRFAENFHRAFGADKPISMWSAGAYAQVNSFALALERAWNARHPAVVDAALAGCSRRQKAPSRSIPRTTIPG